MARRTPRRNDTAMPESTPGLGPCATYQHDHPPVRNVIAEHEEPEVVRNHLEHQDRLTLAAIARLEALQVTPPVREMADKLEQVLKRVEANDQRVMALLARLEQTPPGAAGRS